MVTWKKFGSKADYHSYNYIGNSFTPDPTNTFTYTYGGTTYNVGGDRWRADDISSPAAWSAANSYIKELHYQILDPVTFAPTTSAIHNYDLIVWNRPISTFNW